MGGVTAVLAAWSSALPWLLLAATCVIPTLVLLVLRLRRGAPDRPLAAKIAAWLAMWVGQLAVPVIGSASFCAACARDWWLRAPLAALVYGIGMALICIWVASIAASVFALGARLLMPDSDRACAERAKQLWPRALMALLAVVLFTFMILPWLPMPGGAWAPVVYLALVILPTALAAGLAWLVTFVLRFVPWR